MATKNNLINAVSQKINYLSKEDINISVNLVIDCLKEYLVKENRIEIRNLGSFSIRKRKKVGSDSISYNTVYFRMAKAALEKLNKT